MKTKAINDNQKLAIKFGVPTFETCEKLEWKKETLFTWYSVEGEQYLILTEEFKNSKLYEDVYYPAPQFSELSKATVLKNTSNFIKIGGEGMLGYKYEARGEKGYFDVLIHDGNLAQAFAKLILNLVKNNIHLI